jgi:uncharacterized protein
VTEDRFLRLADDDTRLFWEGCRNHRLLFQKCQACGHVRWPPSIACPVCYSGNTELITASGKGKVYTFAVFHKAAAPAFEGRVPYVVAVVELTEGPRILTNVVGCDPSEISCDMAVEIVWEDVSDTESLPKFRPESR